VLYSECSPISFLLLTKLNDLKDDIIIYLEVLLNHGNDSNLQEFTLSFNPANHDDICRSVVKFLLLLSV
jgi:hypothetical protein